MENGMEMLIKEMTNEEIQSFKTKHMGNASIQVLMDGILKQRTDDITKAKLASEFLAKLAKIAKLPAPPDDIHNVLLSWAEVDMPVGEPEEVDVNGVKSMRQAMVKSWQWITTPNHVCHGKTGRASDVNPTVAKKRAIVVEKRSGNTIVTVGEYANATEACKALNLEVGGDSAMRVLQREKYLITPKTV